MILAQIKKLEQQHNIVVPTDEDLLDEIEHREEVIEELKKPKEPPCEYEDMI